MEVSERLGQAKCELQHRLGRKPRLFEDGPQSMGPVGSQLPRGWPPIPKRQVRSLGSGGGTQIVRQLHDIVEAAARIITADVAQGELTRVLARDSFKANTSVELTPVGTFVFERSSPDYFGRPKHHGRATARKPNLPVRTPSNQTDQIVVGNGRCGFRFRPIGRLRKVAGGIMAHLD